MPEFEAGVEPSLDNSLDTLLAVDPAAGVVGDCVSVFSSEPSIMDVVIDELLMPDVPSIFEASAELA